MQSDNALKTFFDGAPSGMYVAQRLSISTQTKEGFMKKVLALTGVALSPLALVLSGSLPKVGFLLLVFNPFAFPLTDIIVIVLPILIIGILGLLGTTVSDSILFIL
ncbi:MAG: hypothetical protein HY650_12510 [Acidobacteria bacterium]|nr:hypothetical protein [Acidobacteriota bacterium]